MTSRFITAYSSPTSALSLPQRAYGRTPLRRAHALGRDYNLWRPRYERDFLTNRRHCRRERYGAAMKDNATVSMEPRSMDLSAPIVVNAEALPDFLTAKELEAFLRIDVKT